MTYYLAPSLVTLRNQVNALHPERDKSSDGWIGDARHQASRSDHNPDYSAGGVVRALDIDKDGIDLDRLLAGLLDDARTAYVIWNRRIWTRAAGWRTYTGSNPHTSHVHVSLRHTPSAESPHQWNLTPPRPVKLAITANMTPETIATWQEQLGGIAQDGVRGAFTNRRIKTRLNAKNGSGGFRLLSRLPVTGNDTKRMWTAIQKLLNAWAKRGLITLQRPLKLTGKPDARTAMALKKSLNANLWEVTE